MIKYDDFNPGTRVSRATARAASSAKDGLDAASVGADRALDAASSLLNKARNNTPVALQQGVNQARGWVDEKAGRVQAGVRAARDQANDLTDQVVDYARNQPIKSLLIAAGVGAGLIGLFSFIARSDD